MWLRPLLSHCALPPLVTSEPIVCQQDAHQRPANLVPSTIPADRNVAHEDSITFRVCNTDGLAGAAARVLTGMCVDSHKRANNTT